VREASEHEKEDKERREQVERRNKLDNLCYTLEKTLTEHKDKLQAADVTNLEALIKEGREAVEKQDDEKVKSVSERLEKEAHRMASVMYGATPPSGGAPPSGEPPTDKPEGGKKDGQVIDAEFEENAS
jgi:molecular chaperone DnaK